MHEIHDIIFYLGVCVCVFFYLYQPKETTKREGESSVDIFFVNLQFNLDE